MRIRFPSSLRSLRRLTGGTRRSFSAGVEWPWRRRARSDAPYQPRFEIASRASGRARAQGEARPQPDKPGRTSGRGEAAFTMVEIALSLAVIAFALVAIIGVLPFGLDVQKENREETIINHDAGYFMDAIRSGAQGLDDLTNYVMAVTNYWTDYDAVTNPTGSGAFGYTLLGSTTTPAFPLTNGYRIVGLLSTPRYLPGPVPPYRSNYVVAFFRALSGAATEKAPQNDPAVQDLGFSYRLVPEIVPVPAYDGLSPYGRNLRVNLHEVRLLFRWPLLPGDRTGNGRQVYRSQVGGRILSTNDLGHPLFFFEPTIFAHTP